MNLVEVVKDYNSSSDPRVCNWTAPVLSSLPDAGSRYGAQARQCTTGLGAAVGVAVAVAVGVTAVDVRVAGDVGCAVFGLRLLDIAIAVGLGLGLAATINDDNGATVLKCGY